MIGAYMFDFHSFKILHIDDYVGIALAETPVSVRCLPR